MCQESLSAAVALPSGPFLEVLTLLLFNEIMKLLLNLSLTYFRAQIASYKLKGDLSCEMLKEIIYHDRL